MLTLSAFTFGGGYVIVSLMKRRFVDERGWLTDGEMLDLAAIAQSCPGAVAVNAAILVGYRVGGIIGALLSVLATILPPFVILGVISACYSSFRSNGIVAAVLKGMQSGVAAVIADVTVTLSVSSWKEGRVPSLIVMAAAFCACWFFSVNVVWIILACGVYGFLRTYMKLRKEGGKA
jgi:chromate transporter